MNPVAENLQNELLLLYEAEYDRLYTAAFRMAGNHYDAEDLMQSAFVKAIKHLDQFRGEAKLSTWVYRILINEGNRYYKQLKKLPVVSIAENLNMSEVEFFASLETPNEPIESNLLVEEMREKCLTAFMRCLPKNQRAVFVLKTFLELPLSEIAEIMDIKENNAKVILHRARKRIQELHQDRCSLIDPSKPCKCYLWIKFMKNHNLPMPSGYTDFKDPDLLDEFKTYVQGTVDLYALYKVGRKMPKELFFKKLRGQIL